METNAQTILATIGSDLDRGSVRLAQMGEKDETATLSLDTASAMARYSQIMTPQIRTALAANNKLEILLITLLVIFFVIACTLAIAAQWNGWSLIANAAAIPGLGATSIWPIRRLTQLRRENLSLEILPVLLPLLPPADAKDIVRALLGLTGAK